MYKVINCNNRYYCLLDRQTTLPVLLALRYTESQLIMNSLNYQKYELESVKAFYEFWYAKHRLTLDFSFYISEYQDILMLVQEIEPFWEWLLSDREFNNIVQLTENNSVNMRTASGRVSSICRFINFLNKTYITTYYSNLPLHDISNMQQLVLIQLDGIKKKCNIFTKSSRKQQQIRSLTEEQFNDYTAIFVPDKISLKNNEINHYEVIAPNPLNPMKSYDIQLRNYLIMVLMSVYGLRVGEVLLLHSLSFKHYRSDETKVLMLVRNIEDEADEVEDYRLYKPSLKSESSIRMLDISSKHFRYIKTYIDIFRPLSCEHDYIFVSHKTPYKPLSYSTVATEFARYSESFKRNFKHHFDPQFSESIHGNVSPHWLRHTWAYNQLRVQFSLRESQFTVDGIVSIKGIMEDAIDSLRVLGGWAPNSCMPQRYAKRFIHEQANKTLLSVLTYDINSQKSKVDEND